MIETFFIVVLFTIGGEQKLIDGWYPRQSDNYEACQKGVTGIQKYFFNNRDNIADEIQQIEVSCRVVLLPAMEV